MTFDNSETYAPYFSDGRLVLPLRTIELLLQAGLERSVAEAAMSGLALDDDQERIGQISDMLETVLGQLAEDSAAYQELSSRETHFMLTGKRAS